MERFFKGLTNVFDGTLKFIVKPIDMFMERFEVFWAFLKRHHIITMCVICSTVIVPPIIRWLF